ncbi:MAG: GNAT family N-acetyltransferase [Bosea sp. (in: a-proteobacteria)]|uniref:GNAT family N-acetyltransferase n=1 Tax=Bosea sp. (in: a-proteobacteria) TaxID=1871050 RepID=UPI0027362A08|nr:GNAT family N-acetyltransferase [Bosea sp. (in: a-proteobacteria)]MDP3255993.1 GNAT family N-acetyltransferase [Bosea sp. (in: a-proteobacteria)]MDP3320111.1 GNAT family N-acetyltransferase [Bosea sp. (in: a-proteobacteria)]
MTAADLSAVLAVAAIVHPGYPEDEAVFAERLRLFPQGCLVLEGSSGLLGYIVSHPWHRGAPPALNTLLGLLPAMPGAFYIHDLALLPAARGSGAGRLVIERLVALALEARLPRLALVAVNDSSGFWQRQGFREMHDPALAAKLASYDDAARYLERELEIPTPSASPIENNEEHR